MESTGKMRKKMVLLAALTSWLIALALAPVSLWAVVGAPCDRITDIKNQCDLGERCGPDPNSPITGECSVSGQSCTPGMGECPLQDDICIPITTGDGICEALPPADLQLIVSNTLVLDTQIDATAVSADDIDVVFYGIDELSDSIGAVSLAGFADPSICYNFQISNPSATPTPVNLTFVMPLVPVLGPNTVSASHTVNLMDADNNGQASMQNVPPNLFQEAFVIDQTAGIFPLGVAVGTTVTMPGMQAFTVGPIAGPGATGTGWDTMILFVSFILSGHDSVNLQGRINMDTGSGAPVCTIPAQAGPPAIPTLPQWGLLVLVLALLTMATWQLAGRPVVLGAGSNGAVAMLPTRHWWLTSLLLGQGIATLGLLWYAVLVGPLVPHDGVGGFLSGLLLGVMVECYRRSRRL